MNIQVYAFKRNFDVQKAERYFKERGIAFQFVDLTRHTPGLRELELFKSQIGLQNLIDKDSNLWKESTIRFLNTEQAILEALASNIKLLKTPVVRNGRQATVGYKPEIWANWT